MSLGLAVLISLLVIAGVIILVLSIGKLSHHGEEH